MTFEEYGEVVAYINARWPDLKMEEGVLGFSAHWSREDEKELVITLEIADRFLYIARERFEPRRGEDIVINGKRRSLKIKIELGEEFRAYSDDESPPDASALPVRPGDFAAVTDGGGYGTVGWNFYLNGELCALSNWHIFCLLDKPTPPGFSVDLKGSKRGEIIPNGYVQVVFGGATNIFDYAIARYRNPAEAGDRMKRCADGSILTYPRKFGLPVEGNPVYKVGVRKPVCNFGVVGEFTDHWVGYGGGRRAWFSRQVSVSNGMLGPRDSGSLLVRNTDKEIIGLNFAISKTKGLANPISLLGWQFLGMQGDFPSYQR